MPIRDWVSQCLKDINTDLVAIPSKQFPGQWDVLEQNKNIVAVINIYQRVIAVVDVQKTNVVAKMAEWFEKHVLGEIAYTIYSPP